MFRLSNAVDLHALHRFAPDRYPFLLQSTATTASLGRYDILFAGPGETLVLGGPQDLTGPGSEHEDQFLRALDNWWSRARISPPDCELPFTGGWFLYLGYELAGEVEPGLQLQGDPVLPAAIAVRCTSAVIHDHQTGVTYAVSEDPECPEREQIDADIRASRPQKFASDARHAPASVAEEDGSLFLDAVKRAKDYIARGDIYQANLSREWSAKLDCETNADVIYAALGEANPAPFAGLMNWQDVTVISSSPERLLRVKDGIASTRPIAGTRPRSDDQHTDVDLSAELIAHPKERAEHVMLIDLERNDLGRVCEAGSVTVDEMMILESYAHVHHIVSNVRGRLRDEVTPGDAIRAVFPGGTITGCPKVRCMEIISELENGFRGAYTGSMGYLNRDGSLDLNILIRTIVMQGNDVSFRAGSGIVADSEPVAELEETRAKAKGLLQAFCQ